MTDDILMTPHGTMTDPFGRDITYLRVSVTDRCDFRCTYCMAEHMTFLPKKDLLTLEELDRLCTVFIEKGVKKLRLTGGEPLVRKNIMHLVRQLSRHLESGALRELTLTTNGSQLARFAGELAECGVKRINVSLDTLDPVKFRTITRWGDLARVMQGLDAAQAAGIAVKINAVALKGFNDAEMPDLMRWAHGRGMDLTVIETMPMGEIDADRTDQYLPLSLLRANLERQFTLTDIPYKTGGPARYVEVAETGTVTTWAWEPNPDERQPLDTPFAWALVKLDGADTPMLHVVDAPGPEAIRTGSRVRIRWADEREGAITDIACFELEES